MKKRLPITLCLTLSVHIASEPMPYAEAAFRIYAYTQAQAAHCTASAESMTWHSLAGSLTPLLINAETKLPFNSPPFIAPQQRPAIELLALQAKEHYTLPSEIREACLALHSYLITQQKKGLQGEERNFYVPALNNFLKRSAQHQQKKKRLTNTEYKKQQRAQREKRLLERQEQRLKRHMDERQKRNELHKKRSREVARKEYARKHKELREQKYYERKAIVARQQEHIRRAKTNAEQQKDRARQHAIAQNALLKK